MLGLALMMTAGMMTAAMLGSSALTTWQMLLPAASQHMLACTWTTHRWATQPTHESSLQHASQCEAPFTLSAQVPQHHRKKVMKAIMMRHKGKIGGRYWDSRSLCIRLGAELPAHCRRLSSAMRGCARRTRRRAWRPQPGRRRCRLSWLSARPSPLAAAGCVPLLTGLLSSNQQSNNSCQRVAGG